MTRDNLSIDGGALRIDGRAINAELPVAQAIQVGPKVIARFEPPHRSLKNDNVVCFDQNGTLLWTIQPSPHGGTEDNPYMHIESIDHSKFFARNWSGVEYEVNVEDGSVSAIGLRRF